MKGEIWKDIEGFEGYYMVSNLGRVKSLERTVWNKGTGYYMTVHERILKLCDNGDGYLRVQLCKEGKGEMYLVHQLVGQAFLENPEGYTELNHKDENKQNNIVSNLEFCSRSYNITYNGRAKRVAEKLAEKLRNDPNRSKPVIAINKITGLILEFLSIREASRQTGIHQSNICECCNGKRKSAGGFYWMFANVNDADKE